MFFRGSSATTYGVYFVNEDGGGGVKPCLYKHANTNINVCTVIKQKASLANILHVLMRGDTGSVCDFTISNNSRTSFSDSPLYLEVRVEEDTLKKVVRHSVATALASNVFPVPGGPTINTP